MIKLFEFLKNIKYRNAFIASLSLTLISIGIWILAGRYLQKFPAEPSRDFVLDLLPTVHNPLTIGFYLYGFVLILLFLFFWFLFKEPAKFAQYHYVFGFALLLRVLMFSVTLLEAPAGRPPRMVDGFEFDNDLIPSAHAALPFIAALITNNKNLRYLLFVFSALIAIDILLIKIHYTVDVIAGYFVFYAVYKLVQKYLKIF